MPFISMLGDKPKDLLTLDLLIYIMRKSFLSTIFIKKSRLWSGFFCFKGRIATKTLDCLVFFLILTPDF